jgi:hypothetical protein
MRQVYRIYLERANFFAGFSFRSFFSFFARNRW